MDTRSSLDRTRLVRCLVANSLGETSIRFVELDHYKLWEYLIQHRHQLSVRQAWLVVWCTESEFARHAAAFERGGDVEEVDRIHIEIFDARHHYTLGVDRYVRRSEVDLVRNVLLKHVPDGLRSEGLCELKHAAGYGIITSDFDATNPAVLGLAGDATDPHVAE